MSNLVIEVLSTNITTHPTKNGGSYQVCELAYKNKTFQDKVEGKKIMSFAEKTAFEILKDAQMGQVFTIGRDKDDKGYWKWNSVNTGEGNMSATPTTHVASATLVPAKATPKSTYETSEERAAKQVMIVRQSSISSAVALAAASSKAKVTAEDIIETAKTFEAYVMGTITAPTIAESVTAMQSLIDLKDDIPQ